MTTPGWGRGQLGLPTERAQAVQDGVFGPGQDPIWLDEVDCTGDEARLDQCPHDPWGDENCGHHEDADVICEP